MLGGHAHRQSKCTVSHYVATMGPAKKTKGRARVLQQVEPELRCRHLQPARWPRRPAILTAPTPCPSAANPYPYSYAPKPHAALEHVSLKPRTVAVPEQRTLLAEDLRGFPLGMFSADVGPHTEYHYLHEAAPKGPWAFSRSALIPWQLALWSRSRPLGLPRPIARQPAMPAAPVLQTCPVSPRLYPLNGACREGRRTRRPQPSGVRPPPRDDVRPCDAGRSVRCCG